MKTIFKSKLFWIMVILILALVACAIFSPATWASAQGLTVTIPQGTVIYDTPTSDYAAPDASWTAAHQMATAPNQLEWPGTQLANSWWQVTDKGGNTWFVYLPSQSAAQDTVSLIPVSGAPTIQQTNLLAGRPPLSPKVDLSESKLREITPAQWTIVIIAIIVGALFCAVIPSYEAFKERRREIVGWFVGGVVLVTLVNVVQWSTTTSETCMGAICIPSGGPGLFLLGVNVLLELVVPFMIWRSSKAFFDVDKGKKLEIVSNVKPEEIKLRIEEKHGKMKYTGASEAENGTYNLSFRPLKETARRDMTYMVVWFAVRGAMLFLFGYFAGIRLGVIKPFDAGVSLAALPFFLMFVAWCWALYESISESAGRFRKLLLTYVLLGAVWFCLGFPPITAFVLPQLIALGLWQKNAISEGLGDFALLAILSAVLLIACGQTVLLNIVSPAWSYDGMTVAFTNPPWATTLAQIIGGIRSVFGL